MKRRDFLIVLGGGVAAWPLAARAQQSDRVYRIALAPPSAPISELSETGGNPYYRVIFEELRRLGYVEGRNLAVARYSAEGRTERYAELAREVVRTKPDVVLTIGARMVLSFKAASSTIPVVGVAAEPVASGVAASLVRPGGTFTGASPGSGPEYYAKLLELLKEAIPTVSKVGIIAPRTMGGQVGLAMQDAALRLGIQLIPGLLESYEDDNYRNLFGAMAQRHVDAILISDEAENFTHRRLILELAETNRLPTMSLYIEIVEIGGLIAYSPELKAQFRYLASCVDKVLRGENPGEIPIYQSAKFILAINLKTAKALGLALPASMVARADLVIE